MGAEKEKVALVTGAASGIGAATARHFASLGYGQLALVDVSGEERLGEVATECQGRGGRRAAAGGRPQGRRGHQGDRRQGRGKIWEYGCCFFFFFFFFLSNSHILLGIALQ